MNGQGRQPSVQKKKKHQCIRDIIAPAVQILMELNQQNWRKKVPVNKQENNVSV